MHSMSDPENLWERIRRTLNEQRIHSPDKKLKPKSEDHNQQYINETPEQRINAMREHDEKTREKETEAQVNLNKAIASLVKRNG